MFARHYVYWGMDSRLQQTPAQTGGNVLPENYVNVKWALHGRGETVTWSAQPAARDLFVKALANWTNAIPQLQWREVSRTAAPDVWVFTLDICDNPGVAGYFQVRKFVPPDTTTPTGWYTDSNRSANYWKKAVICFRSEHPPERTDEYLLSAIAHEIGHAYGLHEAYIDNPPVANPCNNSVTSLMDAGYRKLFLSGYKWTYCDGLTGPSERDVARVRDFFGPVLGGPVDFTSEASGSQGTFRWGDDAWGEVRHELRYLYRLDSENENHLWVQTKSLMSLPIPAGTSKLGGR